MTNAKYAVPLTDQEAWEVGQMLQYPYLGDTNIAPLADDLARANGYAYAGRYLSPNRPPAGKDPFWSFEFDVPDGLVAETPPNAPGLTSVTVHATSVAQNGTIAGGAGVATVRVDLTNTNAIAGDFVRLFDGVTQTGTDYTLLAGDITAGFADVDTASLAEAAHNLSAKFLRGTLLSAASITWHFTITA